jgi:hypothetical protein
LDILKGLRKQWSKKIPSYLYCVILALGI